MTKINDISDLKKVCSDTPFSELPDLLATGEHEDYEDAVAIFEEIVYNCQCDDGELILQIACFLDTL